MLLTLMMQETAEDRQNISGKLMEGIYGYSAEGSQSTRDRASPNMTSSSGKRTYGKLLLLPFSACLVIKMIK